MKTKKMILIALSSILMSCGAKTQKGEQVEVLPVVENWGVKMADAVMSRHDSLGFYNGRTVRGWSYDVAYLGNAINMLRHIDAKYANYMLADMDQLVMPDGSVPRYDLEKFNIDYICPAKNILLAWEQTGNEKYRLAAGQFIEQMKRHPKTESGAYWHKQIYPWQVWLDGVYMGMPFLAEYAKDFDAPEWFDVATHEVILTYEKTCDPATGLLYHAWDESKAQRWCNPETGLSKHFWSRAMGWYVMAICDILDYLPQEHKDRAELIAILQKCCDALLKVRDAESGCWYQVLDAGAKEGNYLEGSGTAMYVCAFAKGAQKGYLDAKYLEIANEAFDDMVKQFIIVDEDGLPSMINICGSCGLGGEKNYREGTYEYYTTEKIVKNDCKGLAPFIEAAALLNK
ncbi:MAG: glycoside hydrolase family 105 protein [Mangrovibacterium sp.]